MKHDWKTTAFGGKNSYGCTICRCSMKSATSDCLGVPLKEWQMEQIEKGWLDYHEGKWVANGPALLDQSVPPEQLSLLPVDPKFPVVEGGRPVVPTIIPLKAYNDFANDYGESIARHLPRASPEVLEDFRQVIRSHFRPAMI